MRIARALSWAVPLAVGAGLMSIQIARPWTGSYDANGALFSAAARNYLRYGLLATRGGQVVNGGQLEPGQFRFYAHHPPGISLTVAASFAVFGMHEWSARLVPLLFTLGATSLLYGIARGLGGARAGFFAALAFAVQPMVAFYGRMPDHEAPAAFFALLLVALYLRWRRGEQRRWLWAMGAAAFVGIWYAWVAFVVPWLLLGHCWLTARRKSPWMLLPAAGALLGFLAVLGHVAIVEGGLGELWRALSYRTGAQAGDRAVRGQFGLGTLLSRQGEYFWLGFSALAACLALAWLLGIGRGKRADALVVAALALFALFNLVAFKQGAYVHIYYQLYLALPLALAAGLALDGLSRRRPGLWLVGAVCLAGLVGAEGWAKLARIRSARLYLDQLRIAAYVERNTQPDDRILLLTGEPTNFRQVTWYADRNITVVTDRAAADRLWASGGFTKAFDVGGLGSEVQYVPLFLTTREERSAPARRPGG